MNHSSSVSGLHGASLVHAIIMRIVMRERQRWLCVGLRLCRRFRKTMLLYNLHKTIIVISIVVVMYMLVDLVRLRTPYIVITHIACYTITHHTSYISHRTPYRLHHKRVRHTSFIFHRHTSDINHRTTPYFPHITYYIVHLDILRISYYSLRITYNYLHIESYMSMLLKWHILILHLT